MNGCKTEMKNKLRINSKEFHEIESQFRINEIGNKILIFHRKTNFTYSQENEQFGKDRESLECSSK